LWEKKSFGLGEPLAEDRGERGMKRLKFICSRIKKKAESESKNCHSKPMLSLEKPIKLI
jgi:hypothetical protein